MQHRLNILILSLCLFFMTLTDADCFGNIHERGSNENNVLSQFGINVGFGSSSSSGAPAIRPITLVDQGFATYSIRQLMANQIHDVYYLVFDDAVLPAFDSISWRVQNRAYTFDNVKNLNIFQHKLPDNVVCFHCQGANLTNGSTVITYQYSSSLDFNFYDINHIRPIDITDLKQSYTGAEIQTITTSGNGIFNNNKLTGMINVTLTNNVNDSTKSLNAPAGEIFNNFYDDISDDPFLQIEGYECLGIQEHPTTLPMFNDITFEVKFRPLTPPTE